MNAHHELLDAVRKVLQSADRLFASENYVVDGDVLADLAEIYNTIGKTDDTAVIVEVVEQNHRGELRFGIRGEAPDFVYGVGGLKLHPKLKPLLQVGNKLRIEVVDD